MDGAAIAPERNGIRDGISQTTEPITIVIYIIFEPQCGGEKNAFVKSNKINDVHITIFPLYTRKRRSTEMK